jgi:peptidyl-prolyl cis-trans isomerase D
VSDLIETEDAVYLLEPFARAEAHVPPLDEVRDRVLADARRERGEQLAKEKAEALLAQARTVGLAKAAADAGLTVADTGSFDRPGGAIPKLGAIPTLRTEAFALTTEKPLAPSVYTSGGDAVVVALKDRTPADMAKFPAAKDALTDSLMQQKRGAMTQSWLDYLKQRAQQDGALEVRADAAPRG